MDAASPSNSEHSRVLAAGSQWRWPISYHSIEAIAVLTDAAVIVAACAAWQACCGDEGGLSGLLTLLGTGPLVCALFIPAAKLRGLYHPSTFLSGNLRTWDVTFLWLGVVALLGITTLTLDLRAVPLPEAGAAFILIGLLGLLGHRAFWSLFLERAFANGSVRGRKIVLISQGSSPSHPDGIPDLDRFGFQIEHHLPLELLGNDDSLLRQRIDQAVALSLGSQIEEVVIAADVEYWQRLKPHLVRLRQLPVAVSLVPCGCLAELVRRPSQTLGSSILFEVQRAPLSATERLMKRTLDLTGAVLGLLLLLPSLVLVALLIKLDSRGPVLFRQTRLGFNGKPFKIYKFRTMTVLEDGATIKQATRDDDRVTKLGRWLRRTSVDELPQLLNVLKGDMSLVGPRPHAISHDDQFGQLIADYAFRRKMKPGITGWAQVKGYRGATPKVDLMERRVRLDIRYVENWSIWLDLGIIARTLVEVIRGQNAY